MPMDRRWKERREAGPSEGESDPCRVVERGLPRRECRRVVGTGEVAGARPDLRPGDAPHGGQHVRGCSEAPVDGESGAARRRRGGPAVRRHPGPQQAPHDGGGVGGHAPGRPPGACRGRPAPAAQEAGARRRLRLLERLRRPGQTGGRRDGRLLRGLPGERLRDPGGLELRTHRDADQRSPRLGGGSTCSTRPPSTGTTRPSPGRAGSTTASRAARSASGSDGSPASPARAIIGSWGTSSPAGEAPRSSSGRDTRRCRTTSS